MRIDLFLDLTIGEAFREWRKYARTLRDIDRLLIKPWALGAEEDDPDGEVRGEVFEAVELAGWDKEKGAGADGESFLAVEEKTGAAGHEIDFVAGVWFLRVVSDGRVEFNIEGTAGEDRDGEVAGRRRG